MLGSMITSIIRSGLAALILSALLIPTMGLPASANTTSTRNLIYGIAAAAAVFTLYNVQHKHALATSIQGYLPDGSVVYKDGHVASPNGQTWYPGNYGETVACNNQYCSISGSNNNRGQYGYGNGGYNNGSNNGGYYGNGGGH